MPQLCGMDVNKRAAPMVPNRPRKWQRVPRASSKERIRRKPGTEVAGPRWSGVVALVLQWRKSGD